MTFNQTKIGELGGFTMQLDHNQRFFGVRVDGDETIESPHYETFEEAKKWVEKKAQQLQKHVIEKTADVRLLTSDNEVVRFRGWNRRSGKPLFVDGNGKSKDAGDGYLSFYFEHPKVRLVVKRLLELEQEKAELENQLKPYKLSISAMYTGRNGWSIDEHNTHLQQKLEDIKKAAELAGVKIEEVA